jgi:hypothetical protein
MRTTLEIIIAVKDNQPVTEQELKLALLAMSSIEHFVQGQLDALIEAVESGKSAKLRAALAKQMRETMFRAKKSDPEKWLGPENIPGNPKHDERLRWAKRLFKKVTGESI